VPDALDLAHTQAVAFDTRERLHFLNEGLVSEVNLLAQGLPDVAPESFANESPGACLCALAILCELPRHEIRLQPSWGRDVPYRCPITAPAPVVRFRDHAGPCWIERHAQRCEN
jgi:hypothetical protein